MFQQIQHTFSAGMAAMRNEELTKESAYLKEIEELKVLVKSLENKIDRMSLSQEMPTLPSEDVVRDPITLAEEVAHLH